MRVIREIIPRGSRVEKAPVISKRRRIPVIGALTIAVKSPAIPIIMKRVKSFGAKILEKIIPQIAPIISIGKKMPPATPLVNEAREKRSLPVNKRVSIRTESSFFVVKSNRNPPPQRSIGEK